MGIHDKHRERMRTNFLKNSRGFSEHQLLEMLLFHSIPRADTNPTAHRLINAFGGLKQVLDAPVEELKKVEGVGERSAVLLKLAQAVSLAYVYPDERAAMIMDSSHASGSYLWPRFWDKREEVVYMICVDGKKKFLGCDEVGNGGISTSEVNVRRLVEKALNHNATGIILAHNHPSGVALPSEEDVMVTRELRYLLRRMGLELLDHLVIAGDDYVSMADSGLI